MAAVVPSCGSTASCGPENCTGCCDSANKCVPVSASNSNTACGKGGNTCSDCNARAQVCDQAGFVCVPGSATGGGSGATGGGDGATGGGDGTTGGGSATGGGTGTTGGGTATGGGTGATGGGSGAACNVQSQTCTGAGEQCMPIDTSTASCFTAECNTVAQDCPNDGACVIAPSGGTVDSLTRLCVPAGTKARGEACNEQMVECAKGLQCFQGTCQKFCNRTNDCDPGGSCAFFVGFQGAPFGSFVCFHPTTCDLYAQDCSPATDACFLLENGPGCAPHGTTAVGANCSNLNECVKGSQCVGGAPGSQPACRSFCNLDGGTPSCASGTCNPLANAQGASSGFGGCF